MTWPRRPKVWRGAALLLWVGAGAASAENILVNGDFDDDLSGWTCEGPPAELAWTPEDGSGRSSSGSLRVINRDAVDNNTAASCRRCLAVNGPATYSLGGRGRVPAGQGQGATPRISALLFASGDCSGDLIDGATNSSDPLPPGGWRDLQGESLTVPPGAASVRFDAGLRKHGNGGEVLGYLDELELCRDGACGDLPDGGWISSNQFPGFRFRVWITPSGQPAFFGQEVADCIPGALCVSGALANRTEILVRLIGPRPNGFLWLQAVRFTPSQLDVEVEQLVGQVLQTYRLEAIPADEDTLDGVVDRNAFLP